MAESGYAMLSVLQTKQKIIIYTGVPNLKFYVTFLQRGYK